MQHVARVLDAVFGGLLGGREAVVSGAVEVFEAARAVLQVVELSGNDGLLLGHAAGRDQNRLKTVYFPVADKDTSAETKRLL